MQVAFRGIELVVDPSYVDAPAPVLRRQLAAYARGERRTFDLEVSFPDGLTGRTMAAMAEIPYGETRTYGDLADALDTSPVAVGQACGRNPVPVVVPCHRVVGADSLGGFSAGGDRGAELKRALLAHEGALGGVSPDARQARLTREWSR